MQRSLEVISAEGFLKVRVPTDKKPSKSKRGKVCGFSKKSRKRMQEGLQVLDHEKLYQGIPVKFLTLTYGTYGPETEEEAKRHKDTFLKRVRRKCPIASATWRIEWQKRGVAHFHLICYNWHGFSKEWIKENWGEVIGRKYWDFSRNEEPFTRIETIRSVRGCASYVSKYISKTDGSEGENSSPLRSAGFNSVPYLTAGKISDDVYEVFCMVIERAYADGKPFIQGDDKVTERRAQDYLFYLLECIKTGEELDSFIHEFFLYLDESTKQFIKDYEKYLIQPSTGRHWGTFNAKKLARKKISVSTYFLPSMGVDFSEVEAEILLEILTKIKSFARAVQDKLKVNGDDRGFTVFCPVKGDELILEEFISELISAYRYEYNAPAEEEHLQGLSDLPAEYSLIPSPVFKAECESVKITKDIENWVVSDFSV